MKVEIIVLNYNGGELFLSCLPSLVRAVKISKHQARLVILDNGSSDGSADESKRRFSEAAVIHAPVNRLLCSYNDYLLRSSDCEIAILLNNDMRVDEGFVDLLVDHFKDHDLFMVTPKCLTFDGKTYDGGVTRFRMKLGIFWASSRYPGFEKDLGIVHPTLSAGFGAFDRLKFLALGGYDDLYLPGRLEDSDLCFRAWKRGWKLLCEPQSVVYHAGAHAFNRRFGRSGTLKINHRNSFLFVWKNISDPGYLLSHLFFLPGRLLFAILRGQFEFVMGFFEALPRLGQALSRRFRQPIARRSDREIFSQV